MPLALIKGRNVIDREEIRGGRRERGGCFTSVIRLLCKADWDTSFPVYRHTFSRTPNRILKPSEQSQHFFLYFMKCLVEAVVYLTDVLSPTNPPNQFITN